MDNIGLIHKYLVRIYEYLAQRIFPYVHTLWNQIKIHELTKMLREYYLLHVMPHVYSLWFLFDTHRETIYRVSASISILYVILWYWSPKWLYFYVLLFLGSFLSFYVVSNKIYSISFVYEILENARDFVLSHLASYVHFLWNLIYTHRGIIFKIVGTTSLIYTAQLYFRPKKVTPYEYKMYMMKIRERLIKLMTEQKCYPILLRFAWSDAATYDHSVKKWPNCGGANGFIRHKKELSHHSNAGLSKAMTYIDSIKKDFPHVSYADIIQMAGALAVELTGGPKVDMVYGRMDAPLPAIGTAEEKDVAPIVETISTDFSIRNRGRSMSSASAMSPRGRETSDSVTTKDDAPKVGIHSNFTNDHFDDSVYLAARLPYPTNPFPDGSPSADVHIRNIFFRMGFSNRDIVALCGAHTIGRAFKDRSGVCPYMSGDQGATIYTNKTHLPDKPNFMPGGCSWTRNWLTFDNSYYKIGLSREISDVSTSNTYEGLLWLPTDEALKESPEFKTYFRKYAQDQSAFFRDYSVAHKKMSELGVKYGFDKPIKCD